MAHKTAMLERHVDVARLFGPYTWDPPSPGTATAGLRTLPTRYLSAYTPADKLKTMDALARQRAGKHWPEMLNRTGTVSVGPCGQQAGLREERRW
jgi:hypothetical protein